MNVRLAAVHLFGWAALSACDDNPVSPDFGRAEALVQDSTAAANVTGRLSGNVQASLFDGDRWIDLGSFNGITILLNAGAVTVHGEQNAPAIVGCRTRSAVAHASGAGRS
jgi:hypothetical protein